MTDCASPCVYRAYDRSGDLLYVGVSLSAWMRLASHRTKEWWTDVANITVEHFETIDEAGAAESAAILSEGPAHNVARPGQRVTEDVLARRRATRERKRAEREANARDLERTHYYAYNLAACDECGHEPLYLRKAVPVDGAECPRCGNPSLHRKDKKGRAA